MTIGPITRGLTVSILLISPTAWSATAVINNAAVVRVIVDSVKFGGCMVALSVNPATLLPTCGNGYVTFSCTGDFSDQVLAYQKLDQAKLALMASKKVYVVVDDSKKHNGYCFASRIDVLK